MNKKWVIRLGLIIILSLSTYFFNIPQKIEISGRTMGTTYQIKYYATRLLKYTKIQDEIERELESVNNTFSTYQDTSELSQFNQNKTLTPIAVSAALWEVLMLSSRLYEWSNGLWDPTIKPLIDVWGFSSEDIPDVIPKKDKIRHALKKMGFDQLVFGEDNTIQKSREVTVDLSSIAKGYGVDTLCEYLESKGILSYMVEIGGEVRVGQRKPDGSKWRVGINDPQAKSSQTEAIKVLELENAALATSGDYRQFFEVDGIRYSHILNPKTGYPIQGDIVSVSVVGPNCSVADGLATAMMISGLKFTQSYFQKWSGYKVYMFSDENELIWVSE